ncbi:MAG: multidrug transporter, partial [Chitinivibrionales bacterium]|nr:multidrug transporter [Chitinivibrionales bacterium]
MSKQLLIYESARPISKTKHRDWSVKTGDNYGFARSINSVPITAVEFPNAAREYSIVFTGKDDSLIPVVILGVRENENLYITPEDKIAAKYIPAFLRRYPFVFSSNDNGDNFTLCIDESFSGCNQEGRGERLFDAQGEQTLYLKNVLDFLKEYQTRFSRTKAFCTKLNELGLLEPMNAQIRPVEGGNITLTGFMAVNRAKLKELPADQLQGLVKTDELELIYLHLQSLRNFEMFLEKIGTNAAPQPQA